MFILEIYLFISLFLLLSFCVIVKNNTSLILYRNSNFFALLIVGFSIFLLSNNFQFDSVSNHFMLNDLISFIKYVFLFNFFIIFILSFSFSLSIFEYSVILLVCLFSIFLLISCVDLVGIYLLLELQSFCFYILTSLKTGSNFSLEAGLKYFILGSVISGLYVFGVSLLYGLISLTNLFDIKLFFEFFVFSDDKYSLLLKLAVFFILISLLFKLGIIPFHMYIPDVYYGAPTIVMFFFVLSQKLIIIYLFSLFYYTIFMYFNFSFLLFTLVIFTLFFGSLFVIVQSQIKKLLIYSSIVNSGFLLSTILLNSIEGFVSTFFYLFIYIVLLVSFFVIYLSLISYNSNIKLSYLRDFGYIKDSNLLLCFCLILILFSLAGLPPLVGFFSKLFIFLGLSKFYYHSFVIFVLIVSLFIIFYYIRLVYIVVFSSNLYRF